MWGHYDEARARLVHWHFGIVVEAGLLAVGVVVVGFGIGRGKRE